MDYWTIGLLLLCYYLKFHLFSYIFSRAQAALDYRTIGLLQYKYFLKMYPRLNGALDYRTILLFLDGCPNFFLLSYHLFLY